jgi:GT2 family glycosyltransferase
VTVAVCTRNRPDDLALCLDALVELDYPALDLLVVDNAPSDDRTEQVVRRYPQVRYVKEPRPGLDWARNRAIVESRGEIVAYTDDDVIVDRLWVRALARAFAENPEVMAVTGLVVPYELETEAQVMFEMYGGFGRGFERSWHRYDRTSGIRSARHFGGSGQFGTGANMAYRRRVFDDIGFFDPALDVGTVTNGGGDLEMYYRIIKEGHTLLYEPEAIVRHRHRREMAKLHAQITYNGMGLMSHFVRSARAYPDETLAFVRLSIWWVWWWIIRRLIISLVTPQRFPRSFIISEGIGLFLALGRYSQARHNAARIIRDYGPDAPMAKPRKGRPRPVRPALYVLEQPPVSVRSIDISQPLQPITDMKGYHTARVYVRWHERPLGFADIRSLGQPISVQRLQQAISNTVGIQMLEPDSDLPDGVAGAAAAAVITQHYGSTNPGTPARLAPLPNDVSVSIVVATLDRPDDLQNCLRCLQKLNTSRPVEIIVVDNNPSSGKTPPVVAQFPGVVLVREARKGLSYARNAGIVASSGEIIVATDDDVTIPPDWLERLIAPFARHDVMVVPGNVLPFELDNQAQQYFENYGGLGRGFEPFEADGNWFESFYLTAVPTWEIGATANTAFRASIFAHPQIGLLEETLGPGLPSGVGEDTMLFYNVLKAGYRIVYQPEAYVWHRHRATMKALRRQLYNYSKGHVSYHLMTFMRHGDVRALCRLWFELPRVRAWQIKNWVVLRKSKDWSRYPLSLILLEIWGNMVGPWALWKSHQRVRREGRSAPYVPVAQRQAAPVLTLPETSPGTPQANGNGAYTTGTTSAAPRLAEQ